MDNDEKVVQLRNTAASEPQAADPKRTVVLVFDDPMMLETALRSLLTASKKVIVQAPPSMPPLPVLNFTRTKSRAEEFLEKTVYFEPGYGGRLLFADIRAAYNVYCGRPRESKQRHDLTWNLLTRWFAARDAEILAPGGNKQVVGWRLGD